MNTVPCDCGEPDCDLVYEARGNLYVSVNGFTVTGEMPDGFAIMAYAHPGRGKLPMLGVEDYAFSCSQRLSGKRHTGPYGAPARKPSIYELAYVRVAVKAMLARVDAGVTS